jgi:hypothetical protein
MSNELTTAVEKFMEARGVKTEQKADVPALGNTKVKPNILLALPCYAGQVHYLTVNMLMSLTRLLTGEGIPHETHFIVDSLVPRSRNRLASTAAFSTDNEGRPWSHLLFVDADISFEPIWVLKMLNANLPVVALPYSQKALNMGMVAEAAKRGINPANLLSFAGTPVMAVKENFTVSNQPVPVVHAGTGAMLIQTSVLRALAEMHPERKYRPNVSHDAKLDFNFDFFRCGVRGDTYLSEDYYLLEDVANDLKIQPHIIPTARTFHVGNQVFEMDTLALASLHGVLDQQAAQSA